MREYIIKFVQKTGKVLLFEVPQTARPLLKKYQIRRNFSNRNTFASIQNQSISETDSRKMQSKIFCKLSNFRKSTSKIQLSFISAINIGISTQYFASRTFTMVLYLISVVK